MRLKAEFLDLYIFLLQKKYYHNLMKSAVYDKGEIEEEIIRNVHSIEKGLSIEEPRLFFGRAKIEDLFKYIEKYVNIAEYSIEIVYMGIDAVGEYLSFHNQYIDAQELVKIRDKYEFWRSRFPKRSTNIAGTMQIEKEFNRDDFYSLERIINSRHSVRDFSGESVPFDVLRKAITLALRSPSACNRQGFRIHIISGSFKEALRGWLSGISGFAEVVDKYIMITGKVSAYRPEEIYQFQYTVSASIFCGYLSLVLQSLGIGACIVQRPLIRTKEWRIISEKLNIPDDEQIVLMLAIGMLKDTYKVPVSYRLGYDEMVTEYLD